MIENIDYSSISTLTIAIEVLKLVLERGQEIKKSVFKRLVYSEVPTKELLYLF